MMKEAAEGAESVSWHLCWQAAVGRNFVAQPSLSLRIRRRLLEAHRPPRVLLGYTLLPTEIHVLACLPAGDSPRAVARAIGNFVARWVREVQPVRSPVLAVPYRAHRIASSDELREEIRMLAWRPVSLGQRSTPSHYPHTSLRTVLGLSPAQGFDARPLLGLFGDSVPLARIALRSCLARRPQERETRLWELTHGLLLTAGHLGQGAAICRDLGAAAAGLVAAGGGGIDGALRLLETWILAKIARPGATKPPDTAVALGVRGRALVACLAVDHGLCSASSVARHFGRAKATLSEQMSACRRSDADRQLLATPVLRIIEEGLPLMPPAG